MHFAPLDIDFSEIDLMVLNDFNSILMNKFHYFLFFIAVRIVLFLWLSFKLITIDLSARVHFLKNIQNSIYTLQEM